MAQALDLGAFTHPSLIKGQFLFGSGTTTTLYLEMKQFFLSNLAEGIINDIDNS